MTEPIEWFHSEQEREEVERHGAKLRTFKIEGEYYSSVFSQGTNYAGEDDAFAISVAVRNNPNDSSEAAKQLARGKIGAAKVRAMQQLKTINE